ncbi:phosphoenolpyruvate carboxykinase (ATP) [Polaribacter sp. Z022]|uniref:phosphoenolpyruvate carboxykinase (ATP) n=1 Tax=Polaribacter sp. Z022 TaxID=2927125 RepID=UPI00202241F8|nr:phosphoenolpyruvate carboxykinase (ATP) [Polaribacter sp. Z022]MCL7753099.1 phosphoenolpyruvate carboxykinase (ATP) [Polaribacter sp. Z022]
MQKIVLQIAEIQIQIESKITGITNRFKEFYHYFITYNDNIEIDHTIVVIEEKIYPNLNNENYLGFNFQGYAYKTEKNKSTLIISSIKNSYQYTEEFLLFMFSKLCLNQKKIIFHSSVLIDKKNNAYVFFGPSGIGKTTISKKLTEFEVFSDDMIVIEKNSEKYNLHKTPFERAKTYKDPKKVNIKGFYRLVQSDKIKIKRLNLANSFNCLLSNLWFNNYDKENIKPYFRIIKDLTNNLPIFEFHTNKLTTQKEIINILKKV